MFKYSVINYIFGSPGAGKTSVLAYLAKKFNKKSIPCFSNTPIVGCTLIKDEDIGYYSFDNSVILLDEAGISYNNREFKKGLLSDPKRLSYWKLVRHDHATVFIASQSWEDVDKKIRDLSTSYFLIKKMNWFTIIKPIYKKVEIDELTHQPTDFFVIDVFFHWRAIFRPTLYKLFNSYDMPYLPKYPIDPITLVSPEKSPESAPE